MTVKYDPKKEQEKLKYQEIRIHCPNCGKLVEVHRYPGNVCWDGPLHRLCSECKKFEEKKQKKIEKLEKKIEKIKKTGEKKRGHGYSLTK